MQAVLAGFVSEPCRTSRCTGVSLHLPQVQLACQEPPARHAVQQAALQSDVNTNHGASPYNINRQCVGWPRWPWRMLSS